MNRGTPGWPNAAPASDSNAIQFRIFLLSKKLSTDHIQGMIDQRFHALDETHGVRQIGVDLECCFADPAGVDEEEPGVSDGAEGVNI